MTLLSGDRALLDAFRRGDEEALTEVYFHYVDIISDLLQSGFYEKNTGANIFGIRDADIQVDLVQETFARAFALKARLAYDGIRPYKSYLITIARNVVIDFCRRQTTDPLSRRRRPCDDGSDSVWGNSSLMEKTGVADSGQRVDTAEELYWRQLANACEKYLGTVSERQQRIVSLRYRDGLPQSEVAKRLGITRWRVRTEEKKLETGLFRYLVAKKLVDK